MESLQHNWGQPQHKWRKTCALSAAIAGPSTASDAAEGPLRVAKAQSVLDTAWGWKVSAFATVCLLIASSSARVGGHRSEASAHRVLEMSWGLNSCAFAMACLFIASSSAGFSPWLVRSFANAHRILAMCRARNECAVLVACALRACSMLSLMLSFIFPCDHTISAISSGSNRMADVRSANNESGSSCR
eukprot:705734-Rhodomonas_salina.3